MSVCVVIKKVWQGCHHHLMDMSMFVKVFNMYQGENGHNITIQRIETEKALSHQDGFQMSVCAVFSVLLRESIIRSE